VQLKTFGVNSQWLLTRMSFVGYSVRVRSLRLDLFVRHFEQPHRCYFPSEE
jgi:hypothetical protein